MKKIASTLLLILGFILAYYLVENSPPYHGLLSIVANYLLILIPSYFFLKTFFSTSDESSLFNNTKISLAICLGISTVVMNLLNKNIHGGTSPEEISQTLGQPIYTTRATVSEIIPQDGFFIRHQEVKESWLVIYFFYVNGKIYYGRKIFKTIPDIKINDSFVVQYFPNKPTINMLLNKIN
ncbi:MAG: hypothetical protein H7Y13_04935 [Sphingobacteriaceae bacterium]|nr:hypothetical protein [Sphingobacteriaceae bacterium]